MSVPASELPMSHEDYLEGEKVSEVKHEYVAGRVYAMAGASDAHNTVAGNLFALLRGHARGGPCRVFMSNMKLWVESADAYYYPDLLVSCSDKDRGAEYYKSHPTLVVEVLSKSTAAKDRGAKFAHYRTLSDLQEYVLIDPTRPSVEVFRRGNDGHWVLFPSEQPGDEVEFASLDFRCGLDAIYEDVEFPEPEPNPYDPFAAGS